MTSDRAIGEFDVEGLYQALDDQRESRGVTWEQVTRELNELFSDVGAARPIASSTVRSR